MALVAALAAGGAARAQEAAPREPFAVQEFAGQGRTVAAELVDLDGDGRAELLALAVRGIPPEEEREVRVHWQGADGSLTAAPGLREPLPPGAAAYDFAELDGRPGAELVLLEADGLAILSLADREPQWRRLLTPGPTAAPQSDERGLDRLRLVRPELGGVRLLVPGLGSAALLGAKGEVLGNLRVRGRANYFVPPRPGPLIGENEMELFFDVPRFTAGDVDGDGRADLVSGNRHEVRVFLQRAEGRFDAEADRTLPLRLLSAEDHVRNSGGARVDLADLNGDGRADLLVSHASGGLMRAVTRTRIHLNREGGWNLAVPDQVFENRGGIAVDELVDLDADGRPELVRAFTSLGLIDVAAIFLERSIDIDATIHRADAAGHFAETPWVQRDYDIGLNLETLRTRGFAPTLEADWNGDGRRDLLTSGNGSAVEVYLGSGERPYAERAALQALDSAGRVHSGDLEGDGLPDFVIYDPRTPDAPLRVGRNRGLLPGTRPAIRAD